MAVTLYKSTDASAPSLTGQSGSLTTLLDAILVNGYGSQSAAGWTIAYTGTNQRDYKQGTGSNGYYLDVNDNAPSTAQEARMRGYEAMTALATGTNAFPTSAQSSFGVVCRKSNTANSTARAWYCVADATCFHLFVDTGDFTSPAYSLAFSFGDIFSYKTSDIYGTVIIGRDSENVGINWGNQERVGALGHANTTTALSTAIPGHYIDRTWTGTGGSIGFTKMASFAAGNSTQAMGSSNSLIAYPNGPDSSLELSPVWVVHNSSIRGYLKGIWCPLHNQPTGHGDTWSGTGNMAGKTFMSLNVYGTVSNGSGTSGQIVLETSNTWS